MLKTLMGCPTLLFSIWKECYLLALFHNEGFFFWLNICCYDVLCSDQKTSSCVLHHLCGNFSCCQDMRIYFEFLQIAIVITFYLADSC